MKLREELVKFAQCGWQNFPCTSEILSEINLENLFCPKKANFESLRTQNSPKLI